ncbi:MAG TPA: hypothetical protein H9820_01005 [Candidatus Companilactobacillus pullicola]|uniref:WxL domain-containing protein n=1 Tax=Candidatus Companilactobacillus pullicola TaxID=2838523 RepID=A0A9D2CMM8_9LACO|nr:hypothetical protein [Candidatus Companilactobacillus pullicola]
MKTHNHLFSLTISIILVFILGIYTQTHVAQAATPTTKEVYQNTPPGMTKISDLMDTPTSYSGNTNMTSSAHIIPAGDPTYQNKNAIVELIKGTGTKDQLGSTWGKVNGSNSDKSFNYFDLTKKQTLSAWFYMGDSEISAPDGMAFVLQNDSKGANAISLYNNSPKAGETLGVWGGSASPSILTNPLGLEKNAIQNSFAIELDTLPNQDIPTRYSGNDNSFDSKKSGDTFDIKGQHIGWNYPGEAGTYKTNSVGSKYYYELVHNSIVSNSYLSGYTDADALTVKYSWRHFIVTYTPPPEGGSTATIQYYVNRKYIDGTLKSFTSWDGKLISFNTNIFKATDHKVRWGFTASNGSPKSSLQPIAIVMESMPSVADIATNVVLTDITQDNREIKDLDKNPTADSTVNDGDKLNLKYSLTYTSGIIGTGTLKSQFGLPQNVNFAADNNGNIGTISYKKSDGIITTQNIPVSSLTTTSNNNGTTINAISLDLTSLDDTNNTNIIVSLNGTAKSPESATPKKTTINPEHTSYRSDYYSGDVMSPKFILSNDNLAANSTSAASQSINYSDYVKLQGTLKYIKGSTFTDSNLNAVITIDNSDSKLIKNDIAVTPGTAQSSFDIKDLTGEYLNPGTHTIKLYFTDSNHRVSNTLTYTVKVADYKNLNISSTSSLNQTVDQDSDTVLKGDLKYDDDSQFIPSDITLSWSIDGGTSFSQVLTDNTQQNSTTFSHTIAKGSLTIGTHKITVHASDGVRQSNTLTYNLTVTDKKLILTADTTNITVNDNLTVTLNGTYQYSDGSDATISYGTFQVKNEDENIQDAVRIGYEATGNSKGSITGNKVKVALDPIAKNKLGGSLDDYIAKQSSRLKVGRNEITVKVNDGSRDSNTVTYIVNVPRITASISPNNNPDYTITSINGQKLPIDFAYSDDSYMVTGFDLISGISINGSGYSYTKENKPNPSTSGTIPMDPNLLGLNANQTDSPQVVKFFYSDPYARTTNNLTFNLTLVRTLLELQANPDFYFEDVKPLFNDALIKRNGKWDVTVRSFKSAWKLTASSGDMIQTNETSPIPMNADIIYAEDGQTYGLKEESPVIAYNANNQGADTTFDVTNDWDDSSKGIFLKPTGALTSGTYQGEIKWNLTDSL